MLTRHSLVAFGLSLDPFSSVDAKLAQGDLGRTPSAKSCICNSPQVQVCILICAEPDHNQPSISIRPFAPAGGVCRIQHLRPIFRWAECTFVAALRLVSSGVAKTCHIFAFPSFILPFASLHIERRVKSRRREPPKPSREGTPHLSPLPAPVLRHPSPFASRSSK